MLTVSWNWINLRMESYTFLPQLQYQSEYKGPLGNRTSHRSLRKRILHGHQQKHQAMHPSIPKPPPPRKGKANYLTALTMEEKLSSMSTISEASLATSVPVTPMEKPTCASFSAGPSLVPSPVTATTSCCREYGGKGRVCARVAEVE